MSEDKGTNEAYADICAAIPPSDLLILDSNFDPMIAEFEAQGEKGIGALLYLSIKIAHKFG